MRRMSRLRNITSAAAEGKPQEGHWSAVRRAPQSGQRVIQKIRKRGQDRLPERELTRPRYSPRSVFSGRLMETPMPLPGSMRLTAQLRRRGVGSEIRAVKPAPTHRGSADSMNIPEELMSRVLV